VRALRIGLTGPIGCGKSTVAGILMERGASVIDADTVARAVTQPATPGHDAVIEAFGPAVQGPDGTLDRVALATIVFNDPDRLRELEAIVHPLVRPLIVEELSAADAAGRPAVAIEAIKLVEGGLAELCDEIWLVTCDPADQLRRLQVRERLAPLVTRVIDTTGTTEDVHPRVDAALDAALDAGLAATQNVARGRRNAG
jgi:dephospho-CoA kinase